jgi:preprotein translocase subunit SecD
MSSITTKLYVILGLLLLSVAILLPSFYTGSLPEWYPFRKIRLGLDLRGGSYIVLGVKTEEAVHGHIASLATNIRSELRDMRVGLIRARQLAGTKLELQLISESGVDEVKKYMSENYSELSFGDLRFEKSDADSGSKGQAILLYELKESEQLELQMNSVVQAIETIRNRVDQFGVAEPLIQRAGENRLMVQLPDITNVDEVKKTLGSVAKLEFRLLATQETPSSRIISIPDKQGGTLPLEDEVLMAGDAIQRATVEVNPQNNEIQVSLKLNSYGAKTFARITGENVGRSLAIVLDGRVQSYPRINERISEGRAQISGGFSRDEARQLSVVLNSGALPASLTFEEERTVGASLGADSIQKGIYACAIGMGVVILFMLYYYKKAGILAVFCLASNLLFVLAGLGFLGATLTLPGLAGLALTVGMAVDANVIIFERIKEEIRSGASSASAVIHGFERAYITILDANITTLLTGIVLYFFGTGPIKGFAVTLCIGIVSSMFAALYVCKTGFEFFNMNRRNGSLSI